MTQSLPHVAHELGHLVIDSRRMAAGSPFEDTWLDEGLASIAEERAFYTTSVGLAPGMNIQLSTLTAGPTASQRVASFNSYANPNFGRLRDWLQAATRYGLADPGTNVLARRGAGWGFLRYAADRSSGGNSAAEASFLRDLANASTTGLTNLAARAGEDPSLWMRDYFISAYVDDSGLPGLDVATRPYRTTSWNYRSIYPALFVNYPLRVSWLTSGVPTSLNLGASGSASYLAFGIPAQSRSTIVMTAPGGNWNAWYAILRRQ